MADFPSRIFASMNHWRARYDSARRKLERTIGLNRWFPHVPLGVALALFGLVLMTRASRSFLGRSVFSVRFDELTQHVLGADLGSLPDFVIGGLLLVVAVGLIKRARFAWWLATLSVAASIVLRLASGGEDSDGIILFFRTALLVALLGNRAHFSARSVVIHTAFGIYALVIFLVCATVMTLRRGAHFSPEIHDPITALYFVVVTISTVGFGDITPQDPGARGFVLGLISIGVLVLGTAISALAIPLISNRLSAILGRQENPVNRSKHYVVIGTSPLARNAAEELEKRGQAVTLVIAKANDDAFYANRDVVIGDPTDLEVLRSANVTKARGVLALSPDDSTNGFVVLGVNELNPAILTVAALNDSMNQSRIERTQPSILLSLQVLGGQLLAMALTGERVGEDLLSNVLKIHGTDAPAKEQ